MDERQLKLILQLQDNVSKQLGGVASQLSNIDANTKATNSAFSGLGRTLVAAAAGFFTVQKAYDALSLGTKVAADLETAQVGLTTLLGSADKAAETVKRLKMEAQRTPFELPGLTQATQLLTSVTKDGNKSIDTILNIGEALAAMGKGQAELDRIIVNLQQIAAVGHAATIDIKQFAFAGIPIYEMLTETTGKSGEALSELIESGGVTFDLLTKMFDEANDAGGRFFNAYVNQAGTFNQVTSNLKDAWGLFMADLVNNSGLFDGLKEAMGGVTYVLQNWKEISENTRQAISNFFQDLDAKTGLVTMFNDVVANLVFFFNEQFIPAWNEMVEALKPLNPLWQAMGQILGFVATLMGGALLIAINALGAGLIQLMTWTANLVTYWANTWTKTIDTISDGIVAVTKFVNDLISAMKKALSLASELGGGAAGWIGKLLPGRATGGPVASGMPYMVGENGPEMFVPQGNGRIVPNGSLGGFGGGLVVNVYGDVSGEDLVEKVKDALAMDIKRLQRV